ncbi:hypothetical protein [Ureibacillus chungkukjangi]|uniref:Translation initiation factor 2 n=1 Tax=Ureibacillus chungkukjangi TaxID=1202712 RepID=A0A318TQ03_9BACL|nr:hypothetical protein [Ureibacillus chungkukjangi]MCM3388574.1 hypothetical protein [Ureibacillus chungkukjangi]PYF05890.1 hypothetical protein BJ095_11469 [Ureibacillus chungkukjangi]
MVNRNQSQGQNRNQIQSQYQLQTNVDNANSVMSEEEFIAKLSTLAGVIQTVGGIMSTAASFLALQKFQRDIIIDDEPQGTGTSANDDRINELEKQIQYLMKEIEDLKGRQP